MADNSAPKPNVVPAEVLQQAADAVKSTVPAAPESTLPVTSEAPAVPAVSASVAPAPATPATPAVTSTPVAPAAPAAPAGSTESLSASVPLVNPELASWKAEIDAKSTDEKLLVMFDLIGKLSVVERMFDVNKDGKVDATDLISMAKHGNAPSVRRHLLDMQLADSSPPKAYAEPKIENPTNNQLATPVETASVESATVVATKPMASAPVLPPQVEAATPPAVASAEAAPKTLAADDSWTTDIKAKSTDEKLLSMFELVDKLNTVHDLFDMDHDGTVTKADLLSLSTATA